MEYSKLNKKRVCVTLSLRDHQRLSQLAEESGRTLAGYLRWLRRPRLPISLEPSIFGRTDRRGRRPLQ